MCVVVIPAYEPDNKLVNLVRELSQDGFGILVIDDGSGEKYKPVFDQVSEFPNTHVIANEKNMGKGATLKHGFRRITEFFPDCKIFVTADADGQHTPEDIKKVRVELENNAKMVLAVRIRKQGSEGNDVSCSGRRGSNRRGADRRIGELGLRDCGRSERYMAGPARSA